MIVIFFIPCRHSYADNDTNVVAYIL